MNLLFKIGVGLWVLAVLTGCSQLFLIGVGVLPFANPWHITLALLPLSGMFVVVGGVIEVFKHEG